jgi:hypothetical protein
MNCAREKPILKRDLKGCGRTRKHQPPSPPPGRARPAPMPVTEKARPPQGTAVQPDASADVPPGSPHFREGCVCSPVALLAKSVTVGSGLMRDREGENAGARLRKESHMTARRAASSGTVGDSCEQGDILFKRRFTLILVCSCALWVTAAEAASLISGNCQLFLTIWAAVGPIVGGLVSWWFPFPRRKPRLGTTRRKTQMPSHNSKVGDVLHQRRHTVAFKARYN